LHPALCFDCQVLHDEKRFLARFRVFARTAATSDFKAYLVHQVAQRCWPSAVTYSHLAAPATALAGGTVEQQPDTICYLSDEHGSATEGSAVYAEPDGPVTSDDRTWGDGGLNKSRAHLPQPKKQGSHRDKNRDLFCHVTLLSDTKATLEKEIQYFKSRYAALQDKLARLSAVGTPLSPKREYCELLRCYMPSSRRGHDAVGYLRPGVMKKIDRRQVQEMEAELKAHGVPRRQRPSIYANLQKTP
jgi:hypothetical protein